MDSTQSNNVNPPSQELHVTYVGEEHDTTCWGCGSHLLLSSYAPIFKCGWCGAITNQNAQKSENKGFFWRRLLDQCFVCILIIFMLFVISTTSTFILVAFRSAGAPPVIQWGSYRVVGKGRLEDYTFCHYCLKPKPPQTHHCRSCGMCILDMDHHCPFIGNCVGAANHRSFIFFLISAVASTVYVSLMSAYVAYHLWPPLKLGTLNISRGYSNIGAFNTLKTILFGFLRSAEFLPARGFILAYLFVSSLSVQIGLSLLLWQQLCYIYQGNTYLSHLNSQGSDAVMQRDCQNIARFFGFSRPALRYLPRFQNPRKSHKK